MTLLEREPMLARLRALLEETRRRHGRLALVSGEAGIGKTALVRAFSAEAVDADVLWGSCDAVLPARPFAPLVDIAELVGGDLRAALAESERNRVFDSFLALVRETHRPRLVVLEDLHWADDATLDLVRVVGRRLHNLPVLVIGTYRSDEVGDEHPLRLALGDIGAGTGVELGVPPLSVEAVEALVGRVELDPAALHRATAGNPFYVTEVIAAGRDAIPPTVRDAVLARSRRVSRSGQRALRAASVLETTFEPTLLQAIAEADTTAVDECVARGMLQVDGDLLRFRHDLAQQAIRDALSESELVALHRRALAALRAAGELDPGRLARHAVEAADAAAVLELAPVAGDRAAALGAHREAAVYYAAALRVMPKGSERPRAELLESYASAALIVDDVDAALASQEQALECWRRLGDTRAEGNCLRSLSLATWFSGDAERSIELAELAVERLEDASAPPRELARAYATLAQRYMHGFRDEAVVLSWSRKALELAQEAGDEPVAVQALTTLAVIEIYLGRERGWTMLEESFARANAAQAHDEAARAVINLVEAGRDLRRYDIVDRYRDEAVDYMVEQNVDLELFRRRLESDLAEVALERGRWDETARRADTLLAEPRTATVIRFKALVVLGRLRARRGEDDPWTLLDEALELADAHTEHERLYALRAARIEAALLDHNDALARAEADSVMRLRPEGSLDPWWLGELGFWAWRAGTIDTVPAGAAEPYALHVAGRHRDAAAAWRTIGCPYYEALALADSDHEQDLREALGILHSLGAAPTARTVIERLRSMGAHAIPRGPRSGTRQNPAGLTGRELEVLTLLGEGLRDAEIADRLVVSPKTVGHDVSAILRKLGVPNRVAAAEEAARLASQDRETVAPK
jgi:ATP/maltotriose-dependent transcriptional regulator MalT